jgi:hypothetical protein
VLSISFLKGYDKPTLAILHKDARQFRYLTVARLLVDDREFGEDEYTVQVDDDAHMVIPVDIENSCCGVVVVGGMSLCYVSRDGVVRKQPFKCSGIVSR